MKENYKYDISISFAGTDRNIALCIYLALQLYLPKREAYYYPAKQKDMVGQKLDDRLREIYLNESKYVILIISKDYIDKNNAFVQKEIEAFMYRYKKQKTTYLIPILIDDTAINKVHEDLDGVTIFRWDHNPKELIEMVNEMLGKEREPTPNRDDNTIINNIDSGNVIVNQGKGDNHFNF